MMIALVTAIISEFPAWTPRMILEDEDFRMSYNAQKRGVSDLSFAHSSGAILNIKLTKSTEYGRKAHPIDISLRVSEDRWRTFSGFPFGTYVLNNSTSSMVSIMCHSSLDTAHVYMTGKPMREGSSRWIEPLTVGDRRQWIEDVARQCMAGYASERLASDGTTVVAGKSVTKYKDGANRKYINLTQLSQKAGFVLNSNTTKGRYAFTLNGSSFIVPVASSRVKVDDTWIDLPDITMLKNDQVLVPIEVFAQ